MQGVPAAPHDFQNGLFHDIQTGGGAAAPRRTNEPIGLIPSGKRAALQRPAALDAEKEAGQRGF